MPKVSILIPCYNQENFIAETVLSAIHQTYSNLEVVVTDDASTDDTTRILKSLQAQYPLRLKIFLHNKNLGITENHTRGLSYCTGDYVAFLDGDDLFLPEKVEKQVAFMEAHQEYTLSYHDVFVFDSTSGTDMYLWSDRIGVRPGDISDLIRFGNYLPAVGVMARRKDLPLQGYDTRFKVYSDWYFWLSTLHNGQGAIGCFGDVLAKYRRHATNMTNTWFGKLKDQTLTLATIEETWPEFEFEVRMRRSEIHFMNAMNSLMSKNFGSGTKNLMLAVKLGFPFFPWIRLIFRELRFLFKNGFRPDYLIESVFKSK